MSRIDSGLPDNYFKLGKVKIPNFCHDDVVEIITEETKKLFSQSFYDEQLVEVGDSSAGAYPFSISTMRPTDYGWTFTTEDQDIYNVFIYIDENRVLHGMDVWQIEFTTTGGHKAVVNKGRVFKVMATITAIVKDFITAQHPAFLYAHPSKSRGRDDQRRMHLYRAFTKKTLEQVQGYQYFENREFLLLIREDVLKDVNMIGYFNKLMDTGDFWETDVAFLINKSLNPSYEMAESKMNWMPKFVNEELQKFFGTEELQNNDPLKLNQNFKTWFGNSKVVDANGKPLVVYHGTNQDFGEFSHDSLGSENDYGFMGAGFYFMNDPEWGSGYAEIAGEKTGGANVLPVYLKMENPLEIRSYEELPVVPKTKTDTVSGVYDKEEALELTNILKQKGHDGVILHAKHGVEEYVVFEPTQIKSATGNNWEFNPSNADITKEGVGDIVADEIQGLDERQDMEKINEVNALKKEVDEKLRRKDFSEIKRADKGVLLIAVINIPRDQHVLEINFTNIIKRGTAGDYGVDDDSGNPFINVFDCDVIDDGGNNVEIYYNENTLSHELRHYLDWQRGDNVFAQKYNTADGDKTNYYNNPSEYNAFMIQYLRQYVNRFGVKYIDDDFQKFYNGLIKNTKIGEFKDDLNADMQKKFMNRLYAFHVKLKEVRDQQAAVTTEGVGDKYAEKRWGIPDAGQEFDARYQQHLKSQERPDADMGEKVAEFDTETYVRGKEGVIDGSTGDFIRAKAKAQIFKNPKSLEGFGPSVRAISTENGDFYIADINGDFTHSEMGMKVFRESPYAIQKYVTWYRNKDTNDFRFASVADSQYRELMQGKFPEHFYERFSNGIARLKKRYPESKFYIVGDKELLPEGVGDKYAEKKWGIPDTEQQFQDKGVPDSPGMGEKIIDVWGTDYKHNKTQYGYIYKNPTSLKGFDVDVRAIGMPNGDLYVAQRDGDFIHTDMELALEKKIGYLDNYLEFHRAGDSNSFGASDTLLYRIDNHDISTYEVLKALENKHPQFSFSLDYYQDLRETDGLGPDFVLIKKDKVMEQQQQLFTIPELAGLMGSRMKHDENTVRIYTQMLLNAYEEGGDDAVVKMYTNMSGVEIEAVTRGRYMFANLGGGGEEMLENEAMGINAIIVEEIFDFKKYITL